MQVTGIRVFNAQILNVFCVKALGLFFLHCALVACGDSVSADSLNVDNRSREARSDIYSTDAGQCAAVGCGESAVDRLTGTYCFCDSTCAQYGDCCADYSQQCQSTCSNDDCTAAYGKCEYSIPAPVGPLDGCANFPQNAGKTHVNFIGEPLG